MTTDIDSATPIYQPMIDIIAKTLMITIVTQPIAIKLYTMFWVEIKRTMKAKVIAMKIPSRAEVTNESSVGIQAQAIPAVWKRVSNPFGAFYCYKIVQS